MKKRSELFFSLILVPIDIVMMVSGFATAYLVRVHLENKPVAYNIGGTNYIKFLIILFPIWTFIFAVNGLYNLSSTRRRLTEFAKVILATATSVMILIVLDFFSQRPIFPSKSIPIYGFVFALLFVLFGRLVVRTLQRFLFRFNIGVHNTIILGNDARAKELRLKLSNKKFGYNVVNNTTTLAHINPETLDTHHQKIPIDEIIQADEKISDADLLKIITYADHNHITFKYIPGLAGLYRANIATATLVGVPIVEVVRTPLDGWGRIVKRIFDLFVGLSLLILLFPVFLVIAVLVKMTDPGPVFYGHTRMARVGKRMKVYKFRTMHRKYSTGINHTYKTPEEALASFGDPQLLVEFKQNQKLKNDPRVSGFGKFLRRTSLDELPQLYNVLRGQLSLVGPRPVVPEELARYGENAGRLLAIKPGMTGLWQVSGRNDISYSERVNLEIYYVENWSLMLDIIILLRTIKVVLRGKNGY